MNAELVKQIRLALKYFGPLTAAQISEKLALRNIQATPAEVEAEQEAWISAQPTRLHDCFRATGFGEKVYK